MGNISVLQSQKEKGIKMSLLSHNEIALLLEDGIIEGGKKEHINSSSLDIQLGKTILIERIDPKDFMSQQLRRISLKNKDQLSMIPWDLEREGPYILSPREFILAHSVEIFNLPNNISAEYKLKSSMARIGMDHLNAGWCDAGWNGSVLTLELVNHSRHHEIVIEHKDLIGQMIFFSHEEVPMDKSYATRGRYNNDTTVSGAKLKSRSIVFGDRDQDVSQEEFNKLHRDNIENEEAPRRVLDISEVREMIDGREEF